MLHSVTHPALQVIATFRANGSWRVAVDGTQSKRGGGAERHSLGISVSPFSFRLCESLCLLFRFELGVHALLMKSSLHFIVLSGTAEPGPWLAPSKALARLLALGLKPAAHGFLQARTRQSAHLVSSFCSVSFQVSLWSPSHSLPAPLLLLLGRYETP